MLRSTNDLLNLSIGASDGTIGDVKDHYGRAAYWPDAKAASDRAAQPPVI